MPIFNVQAPKANEKLLMVTTAGGLCSVADLRENDLLEITTVREGKDHTQFRLLRALRCANNNPELEVINRGLYHEWIPLASIKSVRLLAKDARFAFNELGSSEERRLYLSQRLDEVIGTVGELSGRLLSIKR